MADKRMKARGKKIQKMTRNGLVEKNLADKSSVRISARNGEMKLSGKRRVPAAEEKKGIKSDNLFTNWQRVRRRAQSRDAPKAEDRQQVLSEVSEDNRGSISKSRERAARQKLRPGSQSGAKYVKRRKKRRQQAAERKYSERSKASRLNPEKRSSGMQKSEEKDGRLQEKHTELAEHRGDSRKQQTGGAKRPGQKKRLQFAQEETGVRDSALMEGSAKKHKQIQESQKERTGNQSYRADTDTKNPLSQHSSKQKIHQEETVRKKKRRLQFEKEEVNSCPENAASFLLGKAGLAVGSLAHRKVSETEEDNAAVEASHKLEEGLETAYYFEQSSIRRKNRSTRQNPGRQQHRTSGKEERRFFERAAAEEKQKNRVRQNKILQKQRIKKEYAKAARQTEQSMGTAAVGTIDYIKKIGGKVTDFFKENRKVYISIGVLLALMLLIMSLLSSCSAMFMQNLVNYTGASYMSSDDAIRQADLYYTQLEANLQERINRMQNAQTGYDEYRYNIAPIEHDPFVLISYLSAKYEIFTFEQVKDELDELFALQYGLETDSVHETVTDTRMVRVGESLGQVVTSGYCNCAICCGQWAGSPTSSGVYPVANHTIAVDMYNPLVPEGTKVIMNGVEYTVEDTGGLAEYGVDFDVYYDDHQTALTHGHQTWEAFLADDNGTQEIEVTSTREISVLNVTLISNSLVGICQNRLGLFEKELYSAYNEVKGNLQMFATPLEFNWYSRISSYYGYRVHPITGTNQMHNGLDITAPEGTSVKAGLDGTVKESSYNDSYGNYIIIEDRDGYELRYAHLSERRVGAGSSVARNDEIGLVGNTGNSTGAHLHIELQKDGERLNPIFYLETGEGSIFGGAEITSEEARRILEEADRYLGVPYVWGGYSPSGFDCSGFVSYVLNNSGVRNWGRLTAQGLYNQCAPVSESDAQPGDLIFFTGTYNAGEPVSHVGIYVGNGTMIHCGHPVQYSSIYTSYWQSHFYAFGRP